MILTSSGHLTSRLIQTKSILNLPKEKSKPHLGWFTSNPNEAYNDIFMERLGVAEVEKFLGDFNTSYFNNCDIENSRSWSQPLALKCPTKEMPLFSKTMAKTQSTTAFWRYDLPKIYCASQNFPLILTFRGCLNLSEAKFEKQQNHNSCALWKWTQKWWA